MKTYSIDTVGTDLFLKPDLEFHCRRVAWTRAPAILNTDDNAGMNTTKR